MLKPCLIRLASPARAALFLLPVAAAAALFVAQTLRLALAQSWAGSGDEGKLKAALLLEPDDPEIHYRLGTLRLANLAADADPALAPLRQATRLAPNQAEYWLGLGRGCLAAGDYACAGQALESAVRAAPMRPAVEQEAASYYAVTGEREKLLGHLRRLLWLTRETPWLRRQLFELSWRAVDDPALVWQQLLAPSQDEAAECDYLEFLAEKNRFDLTRRYWEAIAHGGRLSFAMVDPYLERLLEAGQDEQASALWQELLRMGVVACAEASPAPERGPANLLCNGGFNRPILNAGFDWQSRPLPYLALQLGDGQGQGRGLRIDFTAAHNTADEPLVQLVRVRPNQGYRLRATVHSEAITSDSGPRLRVLDVRCPSCLDLETAGTVGTTAAHRVELAFATGPRTRLLRISVWRPPSRSFPAEISGSVWFDDLSLRPIDPLRPTDNRDAPSAADTALP